MNTYERGRDVLTKTGMNKMKQMLRSFGEWKTKKGISIKISPKHDSSICHIRNAASHHEAILLLLFYSSLLGKNELLLISNCN